MNKPIFSLGEYVDVSHNRTYAGREDVPNGTGFIVGSNEGGILYSVKFVGDRSNKIYRQVPVSCLQKTTICPVSRPSKEKSTQPSLLSPTAITKVRRQKSVPNPPPKKEGSPLQIVLEENTRRRSVSSQPLYILKKDRKKKQSGWLRLEEAKYRNIALDSLFTENGRFGQLSPFEKTQIALCSAALPPPSKSCRPVQLLNYAWGISKNMSNNVFKDVLSKGERNKRSDSGLTILNSDFRRKKEFSAYYCFKKSRVHKLKQDCVKINSSSIKAEWLAMGKELKRECEIQSDYWVKRSSFLMEEITKFLEITNGFASWKSLEEHLQGGATNPKMISRETIRRAFMSMDGSKYISTNFLPALNESSKTKRMNWSNNFWLFWETAKIFKRKTRILLVHMDEKWFYSMVLRRHSKMIPALGIIPKNTHVHHKKHIGKVYEFIH